MTAANPTRDLLAKVEADLRLAVDELCPHGPEGHAEGTCETCDTAFAVDSEIQEAFATLAAALVDADREGEAGLSGREVYERHGWSGCDGSSWDRLSQAARDGWEFAARAAQPVPAPEVCKYHAPNKDDRCTNCDTSWVVPAPEVSRGVAEALLPIRRYAEIHAVTAKALGRDDRDWLDLLNLIDRVDHLVRDAMPAEGGER